MVQSWDSVRMSMYLLMFLGVSWLVSVSDSMVMEVVSAAVSGRELAGNCMRMV